MKVEIINNTEIINQLAEKVDIVSNQISEFEAKTATYHLETLDEFNTVNENIAYLTHRESQTEKEVFSLKNKFQIIK